MTRAASTALGVGLWLGCLGAAGDEPSTDELLASADGDLLTQWATRYQHAEGVDRDYARAVELYCLAAWEGHAEAHYQLGWMYANARGVTRDDVLAASWFSEAASLGDRQAQRMLARLGEVETIEPAPCVTPDGEELFALPEGNEPTDRERTEQLVRRLAPRYGLEPALVLALIEVESDFDPNARSPKNAQGLMQLIPETAARFGVKDILHPLENLKGGMAYLQWLLKYFKGDLKLALAGYNAGENAVDRYRGIPPFPETQHYVKAVTRLYDRLIGS